MSKSTTPNFSHLIGLPDDFSSPQIEDAVALIREGCAVATDDLRRELGRAHFVAHIYSGNRLAAVGAIKRQRPGYAKDVADRAHFSFPTEWRELGYVSVDKLFRRQGLSSRIVQLLMSNYSEDMFATTYSPYMKRTLQNHGFTKQGQEWPSLQSPNEQLSLWLKPGATTTEESKRVNGNRLT